jgi:hypothetical protein
VTQITNVRADYVKSVSLCKKSGRVVTPVTIDR